jgi:hypothetical protein
MPGPQRLRSVPPLVQTSAPLHTFPSLQSASTLHVQVQVLSQPSAFVVFASSHCSVPLTSPSPQRAAMHDPLTQMFEPPHEVPFEGGMPGPQRLRSVPPLVQTSAPLQTFPSLQSASTLHVQVQVLSQPSPFVVFASSHCSVPLTIPSPHPGVVQSPARQMRPVPQLAPSAGGVPATHRLAVVPGLVQVSAPLQTFASAQSLDALQVNRHSDVQPSVSTRLPSSHSSLPLTTPSRHAAAMHAPARQMSPEPHDVPSGLRRRTSSRSCPGSRRSRRRCTRRRLRSPPRHCR